MHQRAPERISERMGKTVAVVGAGVSGLACARSLHDAGLQTVVLWRFADLDGADGLRRVARFQDSL